MHKDTRTHAFMYVLKILYINPLSSALPLAQYAPFNSLAPISRVDGDMVYGAAGCRAPHRRRRPLPLSTKQIAVATRYIYI